MRPKRFGDLVIVADGPATARLLLVDGTFGIVLGRSEFGLVVAEANGLTVDVPEEQVWVVPLRPGDDPETGSASNFAEWLQPELNRPGRWSGSGG